MSSEHAENRWNQIDRYVNGEMVEQERSSFEERMREHAELAQQVHLHRDMLLGMEYYFMQQLKNRLALSDQKKKTFNWRLFWQTAAAVLLMAGLTGAAYYYLLRPTTPEQLFLTYFKAYPNTLTQTNRSELPPDEPSPGEPSPSKTLSEIASAMQHYESGDFPKAALALDRLLSSAAVSDKQRTALVFYRGVTNLQLGNVRLAQADFAQVTQADTSLSEPATWYTGLSYLRDGRLAEAKQVFEQLRELQGDYTRQAAKLLDDLS